LEVNENQAKWKSCAIIKEIESRIFEISIYDNNENRRLNDDSFLVFIFFSPTLRWMKSFSCIMKDDALAKLKLDMKGLLWKHQLAHFDEILNCRQSILNVLIIT
jgi:hypothetical protein